MINLNNIDAIIFDLDDTLYLEKEYVLSGFEAIARYLNQTIGANKLECYQFLTNYFFTHGRKNCLDNLLTQYQAYSKLPMINELVTVYRSHQPTISLKHDIISILTKLRQLNIRTAIVTDGLALMQKNKIKALKLENYITEIVYCWDIDSPKPSTAGFQHAIDNLACSASRCITIGDNPKQDIVPAYQLNMRTVRVLQGRFAKQQDETLFPATHHCNSLAAFFRDIL